MAKKIDGYIKLNIPAGAANPSPPVGPALGQRGINIMEFCKAFNASTEKLEKNMPIPVVITVFVDKSFSFVTKTPPVSYFLKKAAGKDKASSEPGRSFVGKVNSKQVREIAENNFSIKGRKIDFSKITSVSVMTVEGGKDDISAPGQCSAALALCTGLKNNKKSSYIEAEAGHYGIFAGRYWRNNIRPLVLDVMGKA